jgi:Gamma-glutamyl cyclotransferase, AIG2-like
MEHLFSFGTLQLEAVQRSTFGRVPQGEPDQLPGYRLGLIEITDPQVLALSAQTHHPMLIHTGRPEDRVDGTVFAITPEELAQADAYEVADYKRQRVTLASGLAAWVYVDARPPSPGV